MKGKNLVNEVKKTKNEKEKVFTNKKNSAIITQYSGYKATV